MDGLTTLVVKSLLRLKTLIFGPIVAAAGMIMAKVVANETNLSKT